MISDIVNHAGSIVAAIAALGTAAYGLVDTSKAFWGGASNFGFRHIVTALTPFRPALEATDGNEWTTVVRANWLNGMAKDDQKAKAKGLIRLGLTPTNAVQLAAAGKVDPSTLATAMQKIARGDTLDEQELNVFGRFDAMIDAALDAGFERGDQAYRNGCKASAAIIALVMAVSGEWLMNDGLTAIQFGLALLVGAVSVPLAPIAKDISTSLIAAVNALKSVGG